MARQDNEMRSFRLALDTFLTSKGWTGLTLKEGFGFDETIATPLLALTEMPFRSEELQLGRDASKEKLLKRVFQVDAYMESEHRVKAIWDDIEDFMDLEVVTVKDIATDTELGYMVCDTESIRGETVPPNLVNPKVIRWRGIIRGTYEIAYL